MIDPPPLHTDPTRQAREAFGKAAQETRGRSPASFDQWFSGVQLDGMDGRVLLLAARDEFVRDWVRDHFLPDLLESFRALLGEEEQHITLPLRPCRD